MKKGLLGVFIGLIVWLVPTSVFAQTDTDYIKLFTSDITLNQDASIDIKE